MVLGNINLHYHNHCGNNCYNSFIEVIQLFFIAPIGIEALDLEIYSRAIFALQP